MRQKNATHRRSEAGAVAVEAAVLLPALLLLMVGIVKFGAAFWQWHTMLLAVEQAGRYVMVNNSSCDVSCAETQMKTVLPSASVCTAPSKGKICVSATKDTSTSPSTMTLTANYSFDFFGLAGPFTIKSEGTVPLD
jgi:Flp pilus assembly protein TadG